MNGTNKCLMQVKNLRKYFPIRRGVFSKVVNYVKAVDKVDFTINQGETLGLVGESGCGKTTVGKCILRLLEPTEGKVTFMGRDMEDLDKEQMRKLRENMQIIFQDPYGSLNPYMTVEYIIGRPMEIHNLARGREKERRVSKLLEVVGLNEKDAKRYPHEFSGGQRQRIGIARALSLNPKFMVCDEPVSALDVSIQAQVLNLLKDLKKKFNLTYLFISHDLSVIRHISDRVAVMYLGKLVELANWDEIYSSPRHPYTQALLSALPVPDPQKKKKRIVLKGDVPSPIDPPPGCRFHNRCLYAKSKCSELEPLLKDIGKEHYVACHLV